MFQRFVGAFRIWMLDRLTDWDPENSEAFSHAVDRIAEQMIDQGHSSPPADRRDALLGFAPHQLFIVARPTGASEGSRRADR
jgi:hypothetical protein